MTTTNNFQGYGTEAKPSSRVLAPPGGGSSNIFGFDQSAAPAKQPQQDRNQNTAPPSNDQAPPQARPQKNRGEAPFASFAESGTKSKPSQFNQGGSGSQNEEDFRCHSVSAYRNAVEQNAATRQRARGQASGSYNILTHDSQGEQSQFRDYETAQAQSQKMHQQQQRRAQGSGANRSRGQYNPITGEEYPTEYGAQQKEEEKQEETDEKQEENPEAQKAEETKPEPAQPPPQPEANKPHTSTRVRQPPGGASSKLW